MTSASGALLQLARTVLAVPVLPAAVAVRAAALLGRMALELHVAGRLAAELPGAEAGSMRAQLLCLRGLDAPAGEHASHLYGELSRACHQHRYELTPTVEETTALLDGVGQLAVPDPAR